MGTEYCFETKRHPGHSSPLFPKARASSPFPLPFTSFFPLRSGPPLGAHFFLFPFPALSLSPRRGEKGGNRRGLGKHFPPALSRAFPFRRKALSPCPFPCFPFPEESTFPPTGGNRGKRPTTVGCTFLSPFGGKGKADERGTGGRGPLLGEHVSVFIHFFLPF